MNRFAYKKVTQAVWREIIGGNRSRKKPVNRWYNNQARNDRGLFWKVVECDRIMNRCFGNRMAGYTDGFDIQSERKRRINRASDQSP